MPFVSASGLMPQISFASPQSFCFFAGLFDVSQKRLMKKLRKRTVTKQTIMARDYTLHRLNMWRAHTVPANQKGAWIQCVVCARYLGICETQSTTSMSAWKRIHFLVSAVRRNVTLLVSE